MQRTLTALAAARLQLVELISAPAGPQQAWAWSAAAEQRHGDVALLARCRWFASDSAAGRSPASEGSAEPAEATTSSSGSGGGSGDQAPSTSSAGAGADGGEPLPPSERAPRALRPGFSSGARLVQPLRRGGAAAAAQEGIVHINCSLNNTHVVLTDLDGNVKTYTSGGSVGFKNAGKSSPLAAERAAAELARRAMEKGFYTVSVRLKGMGRNKQIAVQALAAGGVSVTQLREVTPTPYNGCRLPRKRRV